MALALGEKPHTAGAWLIRSIDPFARPEVTAEMGAQCALLREIFGNPFRPVALAPEWRTDTVVLLAQQVYNSHDFGAMPVLADALQDAGCVAADVLSHCRSEGPHMRGCWVVDWVLGKE
ncbi:MAG TPA: hypothetical protein VGE74_02935 [Gemmata sp.]